MIDVPTRNKYFLPEKNIHNKGCGKDGCFQCETAHPLADPHCPMCLGSGWLLTNRFGNKITPCIYKSCHQASLNDREAETVFDRKTGINRLKTLKHFLEIPGNIEPLKYAKEIANGSADYVFLTICGLHGNGKTHLAYGIGNEWLARGIKCRMYSVADLLAKMRMGIDDKSLEYIVDEAKNIPGLILDDWQSRFNSDWATARLEEILDHRYSAMSLTVITTNDEIDMFGDRIASRLLDQQISRAVVNEAPDYRIKAKGNVKNTIR